LRAQGDRPAAASVVNSGLSRNVVGRTCTTGSRTRPAPGPRAGAVEGAGHVERPGEVADDRLGAERAQFFGALVLAPHHRAHRPPLGPSRSAERAVVPAGSRQRLV
jgi:hypothetical protein